MTSLPENLETIAVDRPVEHVARISLVARAMTPAFFDELPRAVAALDDDPGTRAVVVTGADGRFSYGLDLMAAAGSLGPVLGDPTAANREAFLRHLRGLQASITAVADCRTPVVAAVQGWCVGGGVDLITAADIRVASADAVFSVREVRMAMVADLGSLQRLVGIVGDGHLRELALTGDDVDAAEAQRIGLVNRVYATPDELAGAAVELASRIAANSPLVTRGVKDVLDAERGPRVEAGLRYVAAWNAAFLPSADLQEAFTAFAEKRKPQFG
ncbi:crotonase/enoyl-CoA hydratase family protein [Actinomycetospora sp. OC33-EN08]|uniref:Crotonase/enoyl-CoA hydratase family protein n=1 Tax=Actinomycetospora aurantiaca TaxID=3129233 RepID=A0ABU8MGW6_9PSEU